MDWRVLQVAKKPKHEHHEEHVDESWLIPYADLLTLLLALFIVLFASSQIDQKKVDQLAKSMQGAFNGGKGFMEFFGVAKPVTEANPELEGRSGKVAVSSDGEDDHQGQSDTNDMQRTNQSPAPGQTEIQDSRNLRNIREELDAYIEKNGLSTQLETSQTDNLVMITIRDQALFASGSAVIKPEAQVLAGAIADILGQYPEYEVIVAGHTDNVPITSRTYESNWDLSTARSLNFMKELFRDPNVNEKRFSSIGYGENRPIASNDTKEGRAMNRRVEVSIMSKGLGHAPSITAH